MNSIGFFVTILVVIFSCEGRSVAPLGDAPINNEAAHLLGSDADDLINYDEEAHSKDVKRGKKFGFGSNMFGVLRDTSSGVASVSNHISAIAPNPITGHVAVGAEKVSDISGSLSNALAG